MSDGGVPAPDELPLAVLLWLARREVEDDDGDVAVPALCALHRRPSREVFDRADPAVLRWIVSALGYHRGREALSQVVALAGHPDDRVRFHVAAALPSLVDLDGVEPEAADALPWRRRMSLYRAHSARRRPF